MKKTFNTSHIDFVERSADLKQILHRLQEPVTRTQIFSAPGFARRRSKARHTPVRSNRTSNYLRKSSSWY
jgi:hypothetical protein